MLLIEIKLSPSPETPVSQGEGVGYLFSEHRYKA